LEDVDLVVDPAEGGQVLQQGRWRLGDERVLGGQRGEVDRRPVGERCSCVGEDVDDGLGDDAVADRGGVHAVEGDETTLGPSAVIGEEELGVGNRIEGGERRRQGIGATDLVPPRRARRGVFEVAAVGQSVEHPGELEDVPVQSAPAGGSHGVDDGVVVLVDDAVDRPGLIPGQVRIVVTIEAVGEPGVGVVIEVAAVVAQPVTDGLEQRDDGDVGDGGEDDALGRDRLETADELLPVVGEERR
jgi:hypothetical protein